MQLRMTTVGHPDARKLIDEVQQEYLRRYGAIDLTPVDPDEFAPPHGFFVVGYLDDAPVACGGWRARHGSGPDFRDGDVEIKRMFVVPEARGRGFARAVLAELERSAVAAGRIRAVLETGIRQPEAIALYESSGYVRCEPFGFYRCAPESRCFAKPLPG